MAVSDSASSNLVGGLIGGLIGGAIGAAIWAAVSYFANLESGWIAWGVGGLAGLGVAVGSKGGLGVLGGISAVLIALVSICGGKYASIHFAIADQEKEVNAEIETIIAQSHNEDRIWHGYTADDVVEEWTEQGKSITWPNSKSSDDREYPEDYPANVREEAQRRWSALSDAEKETQKQEIEDLLRQAVRAEMSSQYAAVANAGFIQSWGAMDILFVGLAVLTAFRIGQRGAAE